MMIKTLPKGSILHGKKYDYKIIKPLGQGTFGITYLASVTMTGELGSIDTNVHVAVKEFFMKEINGREDTTVTSSSADGAFTYYKSKFIHEAQNLGAISHPNIIKVIEGFETNNTAYYVMEYLDGGSLDDKIKMEGPLPSEEVIYYAGQIGEALAYMHSRKMLHLDLKPNNIMIGKDGKAEVIDFGLSKQFTDDGEPESSTSIGQGTPGYAPLEQSTFNGSESQGFPATMDIYALGATVFKMLTGHRPPDAPMIMNEGFPDEELETVSTPLILQEVIKKSMEPRKKDRFQTVNEFLSKLPGHVYKSQPEIEEESDETEFTLPPTPPADKPKSKVVKPKTIKPKSNPSGSNNPHSSQLPTPSTNPSQFPWNFPLYKALYGGNRYKAWPRFFIYGFIGFFLGVITFLFLSLYPSRMSGLGWRIFYWIINIFTLVCFVAAAINCVYMVKNRERNWPTKMLLNFIFFLGLFLLFYLRWVMMFGL